MTAHAWQTPELTQNFLTKTRAALPLAAAQLDVMLFVIRRALPDVGTFLDVGSGSGILSRLLLQQYPQAKAVLVDFSEPMLAAARDTLPPEQTTIVQQDLNDTAWLNPVQSHAPFDAVVSGYAIHHLTDERKKSLYQEIFGLLKPGGIFINVEHIASPTEWVEDLFNHAFAMALYDEEVAKEYTYEELIARLKNQDDGDICASVDDQCHWLRDIGFEHVDCYMKIYALAVFGGIKPKA
jgi:ubiquinone/menaquinone biosynthesis C-methylase UbiE